MKQMEKTQSAIQAWGEQAIESDGPKCNHDCRITCKMLTEAMRKEAEMIHFYETIMTECDYPAVNSFVRGLLEEKSRIVLHINQKLNEIRACGQVSNGVISDCNPEFL
jgi:Zn ribbon nucleic-acid-binding protein